MNTKKTSSDNCKEIESLDNLSKDIDLLMEEINKSSKGLKENHIKSCRCAECTFNYIRERLQQEKIKAEISRIEWIKTCEKLDKLNEDIASFIYPHADYDDFSITPEGLGGESREGKETSSF